MKKILWFLYFFVSQNIYDQTLRMVTVAALDDKELSSAAYSDIEVMKANSIRICNGIKYKLSTTILGNADFNSQSVLKVLDTLKVEAQDIIFFITLDMAKMREILQQDFPSLN